MYGIKQLEEPVTLTSPLAAMLIPIFMKSWVSCSGGNFCLGWPNQRRPQTFLANDTGEQCPWQNHSLPETLLVLNIMLTGRVLSILHISSNQNMYFYTLNTLGITHFIYLYNSIVLKTQSLTYIYCFWSNCCHIFCNLFEAKLLG